MVANAAEGDKVAGKWCNVILETIKLLVIFFVFKVFALFAHFCLVLPFATRKSKMEN